MRHEQSAAFMGQAYSRLLQKPSACMAASGPGVTSFIVDAIHARCAGLHQCLDFARVRCTWQSIRIGITAETRSVRTLLVGRVDVAGHGSKRGRSSSCKLDLTRLPHARKVSYFPRWLLVADLAAVKERAFSVSHKLAPVIVAWAIVLSRDQQIRKALEVLKPPPTQRAECQHDIELALDMVEQRAAAARSFRMAVSKKGKAGLKRYHAALRRLRIAYRSLDPAISPWFSLAETAYISGKPTVIDREITMAEAFLARPSLSPRRDASRNKVAVQVANHLLDWWGPKASVTRGGKWEKLAKILTGDLTIDLFDHLREFKRRPGPRIEKLRGAHSIVYRTSRR